MNPPGESFGFLMLMFEAAAVVVVVVVVVAFEPNLGVPLVAVGRGSG